MSHFVNTNFVFFCYFSVLFLLRMPAISFYIAAAPSYLFIHHHSHIIQPHVNLRLQLLLTHVCPVTEFAVASHLNTALSVPKVPTREQYQNFTFPLLFFLPIFPFSSIIMILVHFGTCFFICRQFFHILQVPAILMFSFFDDFHNHFHTYALKR